MLLLHISNLAAYLFDVDHILFGGCSFEVASSAIVFFRLLRRRIADVQTVALRHIQRVAVLSVYVTLRTVLLIQQRFHASSKNDQPLTKIPEYLNYKMEFVYDINRWIEITKNSLS